jgi:predicted permease
MTLPGAFDDFIHDARLTIRSLRSSPGFTSAVVILLALGIGANVAVLSVAETLFVRPPSGVAHPETLRRLYLRSNWSVGNVTIIRSEFSFPSYLALRDAYRDRVALAGYIKADTEVVGDGLKARVAHATANFFPVLGVLPAHGRFFSPDEDRPGDGRPVAVISDAFWRSHFGGDPGVVGKPLNVEFARYTIIGIAPPEFTGPDLARTDVWIPFGMLPTRPGQPEQWYNNWRMGFMTEMIARVSSSTPNPDSWLTALGTVVYRRGEAANVTNGADTTATLLTGSIIEALGPSITPSVENAITLRLLGVTAILLLIAFANVGNLLIARMLNRRNEVAVRIALGIGRARLVSQFVTEASLLSLFAAAVAVLPAVWGAAVLRGLLLPGVPIVGPLLDVRVLGVAIGIAVVGGVGAGLLPAWRLRHLDIAADIRGTRGHELPSRVGFRDVLVVAQAALSVLLLVGAGLFIRSLHEVRSIDLGYNADRLVYGAVQFRNPQTHEVDRWGELQRADVARGLEIAATSLRRTPGVEGISLTGQKPMRSWAMVGLLRADGSPVPRLQNRDPIILWVDASFLDVTGIRLVRGRFFTKGEVTSGAPVMVVNETAAKAYWPGQSGVGECLQMRNAAGSCSTVVGVVQDAHLDRIVEDRTVQTYVPVGLPQVIVARAAAGRSAQAAAAMVAELRRQFPTAEAPNVRTMETALEPELRPWRLGSTLFSLFGAIALLIAAFGLYSVVSYSVSQRTRELGIRAALGADSRMLVSQVTRQGLRAPVVGFVVGIVLALLLWPAIAAMVYGVKPGDPTTLAVVGALLIVTAIVATVVPAIRAARVDVVKALRAD